MLVRLLAACLSAFALVITGASADPLIGSTVPPFPNGMYSDRGTCSGKNDGCDQLIAIVKSAAGTDVLIFAGRSAGRDKEGGALWLVTDTLRYPKVGKGKSLEYGTCRNHGVDDESVIAVAQDSKKSHLKAVGWAYRVDPGSGKFVKLDPAQVDCVNTALDAD